MRHRILIFFGAGLAGHRPGRRANRPHHRCPYRDCRTAGCAGAGEKAADDLAGDMEKVFSKRPQIVAPGRGPRHRDCRAHRRANRKLRHRRQGQPPGPVGRRHARHHLRHLHLQPGLAGRRSEVLLERQYPGAQNRRCDPRRPIPQLPLRRCSAIAASSSMTKTCLTAGRPANRRIIPASPKR